MSKISLSFAKKISTEIRMKTLPGNDIPPLHLISFWLNSLAKIHSQMSEASWYNPNRYRIAYLRIENLLNRHYKIKHEGFINGNWPERLTWYTQILSEILDLKQKPSVQLKKTS